MGNAYKSFLRQVFHVVLAAGAIAAMGCGEKETAPPPVRPAVTMIVKPTAATAVRTYPARIEPADDVELSFDVNGPLEDLAVQEGDRVKQGQLVGQVRQRDYKIALRQVDAKIAQAEAELKKMQAGARPEDIARLEAALRSAQVTFKTNEATLGRMKQAFAQGAATQTELDNAQEARDRAAESVQEAQEALNIGKAGARPEDVEAAQAQIEALKAQQAQAQARLDDTTLTAPFEGVITRKYVEQYQNVQPKQAVVRLVSDDIEARVDVPEQDVLKRSKEQAKLSVLIRGPDGKTVTCPATIKKWSPEADPTTGAFAVYLTVAVPEDVKERLRVLSGMSATARAEFNVDHDNGQAYRVPLEAVFSPSAGKSSMWIVQPSAMTVTLREVKVGEQTEGQIWVTDGLEVGEEILIAGVHYVREGQQIRRMTGAEADEITDADEQHGEQDQAAPAAAPVVEGDADTQPQPATTQAKGAAL